RDGAVPSLPGDLHRERAPGGNGAGNRGGLAMTRFVPYPLLAAFLFLLWLALGGSYSPGWTLLGVLVAVGGTWIMAALRLDEPRMQNARAAVRLAGVVSID